MIFLLKLSDASALGLTLDSSGKNGDLEIVLAFHMLFKVAESCHMNDKMSLTSVAIQVHHINVLFEQLLILH